MKHIIKGIIQNLNPINLNCRIASADDIVKLKKLDNTIFGIHQSVSEKELSTVIENGYILIVENEKKEMIGQSQVLLNSSNILKYPLNSSQAFAYGTGILNKYQGKGIGSILRKGQILLAKKNDKNQILATCRMENYYSLKSLFKLGYYGDALYKNYYGKLEDGGGRISLSKQLKEDILTIDEIVNIPIEFEGLINIKTYELVQKIFNKGFILTGIECMNNDLANGILTFKKKKAAENKAQNVHAP